MPATRLDQALVSRGLVESRTKAQRRIAAGTVVVDGVIVTKPAVLIDDDQVVIVEGDPDYVGRGALKLLAALEEWGIDVTDLKVLDLGASTGGFTQVLCERGASRVIALDVGHGQLHESLRADPRVVLVEGVNAKNLSVTWWAENVGEAIDLVVADLSFISLTQVIPAVVDAIGRTPWVCLVKPQFEVGRLHVVGGLAPDPDSHEKAINAVIQSAEELGLNVAGVMVSPLTGEAGNREYLCWLSPTLGRNQTQWSQHIHTLSHP
jgi:23S rRNA (cytidine1920-2'-O)/16S rRNA (cytidine1409-2'-O)-methyltransferase